LKNKYIPIGNSWVKVKLAPSTYDSVVSGYVNAWIPHSKSILARFLTALRPGGTLYLQELGVVHPSKDTTLIHEQELRTGDQLTSALRLVGFSNVKTEVMPLSQVQQDQFSDIWSNTWKFTTPCNFSDVVICSVRSVYLSLQCNGIDLVLLVWGLLAK
jgi:PPE-repeat protein